MAVYAMASAIEWIILLNINIGTTCTCTAGLRSDRDLLENGMSFDLGLTKDSSSDEVDKLIKRLDSWQVNQKS